MCLRFSVIHGITVHRDFLLRWPHLLDVLIQSFIITRLSNSYQLATSLHFLIPSLLQKLSLGLLYIQAQACRYILHPALQCLYLQNIGYVDFTTDSHTVRQYGQVTVHHLAVKHYHPPTQPLSNPPCLMSCHLWPCMQTQLADCVISHACRPCCALPVVGSTVHQQWAGTRPCW